MELKVTARTGDGKHRVFKETFYLPSLPLSFDEIFDIVVDEVKATVRGIRKSRR